MRRLKETLRRLHPDNLQIVRAGLSLAGFTLAAKLAGAGKDVIVAWRFGRGPEVDAYNLAFVLATWLPVTLFSIMTVVLVPLLVRLRSGGPEQLSRFLRELYGFAILGGVALAILVGVLGPLGLRGLTGPLPESTRSIAEEMLRGLAPLALLTLLVAVATSRLQSVHDHRYALSEGIPALAIVAALLACDGDGGRQLVGGTVAGFAVQAWWLGRQARQCDGCLPAVASFLPRSKLWGEVWRGAVVIGTGQFLISCAGPVDQWFAATLGPGANATLGYANRILAVGMTIGATVIARATLPVFAEAVAAGQGRRAGRRALRWSLLMLGAGAAMAGLLAVAAPWIVELLFQRGAFSAADTQVIAEALRAGAWQLPPYFAGLVLVSLLASRGRYGLLSAGAALSMAVKLTGNYALAPSLGVSGLLLATAAMYVLSGALYWAAVTRLPDDGSPTGR